MSKTKTLLGIDEVGRGPWAGPLVIGAVILGKPRPEWDELTDSKKLTAKKRETLSPIILEHAKATGLGWVSAAELDKYGLSNALKLAARRAVKQVLNTKVPFDEIIIDGTINFLQNTPLADRVTTLKKADLLVKEVSAASIIAKVARDQYMIEISEKYPEYGFASHVGYGTAAHKQALLNYGICPEHRKSFRPVREIWARESEDATQFQSQDTHTSYSETTTELGRQGESAIAIHLESLGHEIIARNYRTKTYEIDIISTCDDQIYFTEVKYRHESSHGTPLDQITKDKRERMQRAAEDFLEKYPNFANYQPLLAAGLVSGETFTVEDWFTLS